MPQWVAHFDPRAGVANSAGAYLFIQLFRPAYFACASFATWCLRKSWTVAVERRNTAGSGEWRFVLREEYHSLADALDRRTEIVNHWRDELLRDWRNGDYAARPFVDEDTTRHDTTSPS